ncbi:Leo1-like protein-domain-containing protein [Polychytrium aggregatum]|uniref:Leo1-like protein-domain-containing protein n=1 Tax=Polychytrium aggregatum TaxID=110093 RepID=UPI0022FDFF15|nr:Leo1-like protein-domain-containing protein [Polychytrium aggregatum]KAI9190759.1 Leo1-like protein-domain-containing protein [Polychytrium aggregatum]
MSHSSASHDDDELFGSPAPSSPPSSPSRTADPADQDPLSSPASSPLPPPPRLSKLDSDALSDLDSGSDADLPRPGRIRRDNGQAGSSDNDGEHDGEGSDEHLLGSLDELSEDESSKKTRKRHDENAVAIDVPSIGSATGSGSTIFLAKLPNYIDVAPKPFTRESYIDSIKSHTEEKIDDEMLYRLRIENTIRWRYEGKTEDGTPLMESNARLIRWSDGTFSMLLGEEMFDVDIKNIENEHQYLVAKLDDPDILQTQARFGSMMTLKPTSMGASTHRKLTMAVANKHKKEGRIKFSTAGVAPTLLIEQQEQAEALRIKERAKIRREKERSSDKFRGDEGYGRDSLRSSGSFFRSKSGYHDSYEDSYGRSTMNNEEYDDGDGFVVQDHDDEDDRRDARLQQAKSGKPGSSRRHTFTSSEDEMSLDGSDEDGDDGNESEDPDRDHKRSSRNSDFDRKSKRHKREGVDRDRDSNRSRGQIRDDDENGSDQSSRSPRSPAARYDDDDEDEVEKIVRRSSNNKRQVVESDDD